MSIIGLFLLINKSYNTKTLASSMFFGIGLIILYLSSFIYHILPINNLKKIFRIIDHCNVFLLELCTFMPLIILVINYSKSLIYLTIILIVTVISLFINIFYLDKVQMISVIIHLLLGWSIFFCYSDLINYMGYNGTLLLFLGGIFYSIGAILYKIGSKIKYFHSVFHIFCLIGSFCHFIMVYSYILKLY